jgi:hypothetical protein
MEAHQLPIPERDMRENELTDMEKLDENNRLANNMLSVFQPRKWCCKPPCLLYIPSMPERRVPRVN